MKAKSLSPESKLIEYKEFLDNYERFLETVVAFSNTQGGDIIVGIRFDNIAIGLDDEKLRKYHEELPQAVADAIVPQTHVEIFERAINEKVCLVVRVYPGPGKPYYLKKLGYPKGVFLRYGSHNRLADDFAIDEFDRIKKNLRFEELLVTQLTINDLDPQQIKEVETSIGERAFINLGYLANTPSQKICPNQAAVLLFHPNPEQYIAESNVMVTHFSGTDNKNIIKREVFNSGLLKQFKSSFQYIKNIIGRNARLQEARMEYQNFEYPLDVIREVLVNALVHRAYGYEMPIRVSIFSDRIEFLNSGTFFAPIHEETLRFGLSRYRNPLIANAFRRAKLMEKQGIGINKIFEGCSNAGLLLPLFQEIENFVKVTLFNRIFSQKRGVLRTNLSYSKYVAIFTNHNHLSSQQFAKLIGKSQSTAKNILRVMIEQHLIVRFGSGRSTIYKILEDMR
jgi:ATP-dependent DNA helicase RecG